MDKSFLMIPLEKVKLLDDKGKEIKDVLAVQNYMGDWVIAAKDGIYTNCKKLIKDLGGRPPKKKYPFTK